MQKKKKNPTKQAPSPKRKESKKEKVVRAMLASLGKAFPSTESLPRSLYAMLQEAIFSPSLRTLLPSLTVPACLNSIHSSMDMITKEQVSSRYPQSKGETEKIRLDRAGGGDRETL